MSREKAGVENESVTVLLELPVPVVQGTNLSSLKPTTDAVKVESMIAHPPSNLNNDNNVN